MPTEENVVQEDPPSKSDDEFMDVAFGKRPVAAYETLARFAAVADGADTGPSADAVARAWLLVSRDIVQRVFLLPEAAELVRYQLMVLRGDDVEPPHECFSEPIVDDAATIANVALEVLAREHVPNGAERSIQKMIDALEGRKAKAENRRASILSWVRYSEDETRVLEWINENFDDVGVGDDDERDADEFRQLWRAAFLREHLGTIDPCLRLDADTAADLVHRLGDRKGGAAKLAANWVWRSGLEHDGKPQRRWAKEAFVERFQRDPAKKRTVRARLLKKPAAKPRVRR